MKQGDPWFWKVYDIYDDAMAARHAALMEYVVQPFREKKWNGEDEATPPVGLCRQKDETA